MGYILAAIILIVILFFIVKFSYRYWRVYHDQCLDRKTRRLQVKKLSVEVDFLHEELRQRQIRFNVIECQGFQSQENREDLRLKLTSSIEYEKIKADNKGNSIQMSIALLQQLQQLKSICGSAEEQNRITELLEMSQQQLELLNVTTEKLDGKF